METEKKYSPLEEAILKRETERFQSIVSKAFHDIYLGLRECVGGGDISLGHQNNAKMEQLIEWINELKPIRDAYYAGYYVAQEGCPRPPAFIAEMMVKKGVKELLEQVASIESLRGMVGE